MTFLVVEKGYRFYCSYQKKLLFSYYWLSTLLSNLYNTISMTTIPPHEMYNNIYSTRPIRTIAVIIDK